MFEASGFAFACAIEFNVNPFEHRVQLARNLGIPEPDDAISFPLKPKLPFPIALRGFVIIVVSAVEFDDQVRGRTEKIYDVRTDWRLTAEVRA
jgi:hypothetical protein